DNDDVASNFSVKRAGKVRSITPRVIKVDQKKPKVGRAKKRHLYNRRSRTDFGRKVSYNKQS
ncbi:hypothetical protein SAMD00019534_104170, partial [Acytostelium subglobosum LB1]|uniref:hypothetical protein n=1 Tax=Acytostelium subglobosum LB1 TaxID=1410327 RepID=UPI0006451905